MVGAASFDDMVAISGYSLFSSFAMSSIHSTVHGQNAGGQGAKHHSLAWTLLHGKAGENQRQPANKAQPL